MRGFDQWLFEGSPDDIEIPNLDLAIRKKRADMPKLSDIAQFASDLAKGGIGMDVRMVNPKSLKPGQTDFDMEKVKSFMMSTNPTLDAPLYISKDMHVIDGHHRWIAAANNNVPILVHHIDMVFYDLIEFLNSLSYPLNRDVE